MTAAASPPTNLRDKLEEMRASVTARGARKGLAAPSGLTGALREAILVF
jgi:hypothetical protein